MSGDFWTATQKELQPLFQSPNLSEKLLQKPPFKFLFDIVSSLLQTGFGQGVFTEKELDREGYSEKEAKMAFLSRYMQYVSLCLGEEIAAQAKKILAGSEPEKTNAFLVQVARAAKRGDAVWADALQRLNANAPPPPPPPPPPPTQAPRADLLEASIPQDLKIRQETKRKELLRLQEGAKAVRAKASEVGVTQEDRMQGTPFTKADAEQDRMLEKGISEWVRTVSLNLSSPGESEDSTAFKGMPVEAVESDIKATLEKIDVLKGIIVENEGLLDAFVRLSVSSSHAE